MIQPTSATEGNKARAPAAGEAHGANKRVGTPAHTDSPPAIEATGSTVCPQCGYDFRASGSTEADHERQHVEDVSVAPTQPRVPSLDGHPCPSCHYGVLRLGRASLPFRPLGLLPGLQPHTLSCAVCEYTRFRWRSQPNNSGGIADDAPVTTPDKEADLSGATIDDLVRMLVVNAVETKA